VFQLGKLYNERYLPLKDRSRGEGPTVQLAGDLRDLLEPED